MATLPLRPDGVRGTLEFVFAVHPSSTVQTSEVATPQKHGANITHEALSLASTMLSVPPKRVTPELWFSGIGTQLLKLLDGNDGPELTKVAAYVIGFGILGRREFGAPGKSLVVGFKNLSGELISVVRLPRMEISCGTDGVTAKPLSFKTQHDTCGGRTPRRHRRPQPGSSPRVL